MQVNTDDCRQCSRMFPCRDVANVGRIVGWRETGSRKLLSHKGLRTQEQINGHLRKQQAIKWCVKTRCGALYENYLLARANDIAL